MADVRTMTHSKTPLTNNSESNLTDPYDSLLMVPGPTIVHQTVRKSMSNNQMGHLSSEFTENFRTLLKFSKKIFLTESGYPFIITGSGTVAMEAAVLSLLEPNDNGLILDTGYFAQRFVQMLSCYDIKSNVLSFEFGKHADPDKLKQELKKYNPTAVFITHVDTSSTIMNNIKELVNEVKDTDTLSIVDSVCGVGGCELNFDKLGADVVLTTSQKALGSVPGAGILMLSKKAIEILENRQTKIPSYYLNLKKWKTYMDNPSTYLATPAIQVMEALKISLEIILDEGIENRWARHERISKSIRCGLESLNLGFTAEENYRANTVTGFYVPAGKSIEIQSKLKQKYKVEVASGFGQMKNNSLRVGHMANIKESESIQFLNGLESILQDYDSLIKTGTAQSAAEQHFK